LPQKQNLLTPLGKVVCMKGNHQARRPAARMWDAPGPETEDAGKAAEHVRLGHVDGAS
jgi:hypothetical protein